VGVPGRKDHEIARFQHARLRRRLAAMRAVGRAAEQAAVRAGLPRLVFLSSMGAHRHDLGPVTNLGEIEAALRAARPNVVALRAAYFFENTFAAIPTIAQAGAIFGNFDPDLAFPQVATRLDAVAEGLAATGMTPSGVDGYRVLLGGLAASRFERPEARTREISTATEFAAWARLALRPAFDTSAAAMQPAAA
jgi:uncharacterized protein YbjT (DUF2867 family)